MKTRLRALVVAATAVAMMATMLTGAALASTDLHPPHVGADSTTFKEECKGDEGLEPGQVLWHFVLVQTTALNTGTLSTTFQTENGGVAFDTVYDKFVGGVVHWNVITGQDDILLAASTDADGGQLNLSHVCGGGTTTPDGRIVVKKYFDHNGDGILDAGDTIITGWKVNIDPSIGDTFTTVSESVAADTYAVTEYYSTIGSWTHSFSYVDGVKDDANNPVYANVLSGGTATVEFGNYCTVPSGGKTMGYWSNKNGENTMKDGGSLEPELALLRTLNLRNADGSNFDPTTYTQYRTWLLSASATNMAYMLSAQLSAMALNVEAGFVNGALFVPGYGGTVNDLIAAANTSLGADGLTLAGDPNRSSQEILKNHLDGLNNGGGLIPATPCAFSFEAPV